MCPFMPLLQAKVNSGISPVWKNRLSQKLIFVFFLWSWLLCIN